ncbi:MAG: class I SAM-dependent methyltransferase [bacterium]|nr:class I SAM-dependent methyltransferase [bacterium]
MITQKILLDVGCGFNKQPGYTGMDKRPVDGVDIVHDAECFPWPLDDDDCAVIVMSHMIEHIKPWLQIDFMNEAWRILEMGGLLFIATPYATSFGYSQDPTHCSPWNEATVDYFTPGKPLYEVYRPLPWQKQKLAFDKRFSLEVVFKKISVEGGDDGQG